MVEANEMYEIYFIIFISRIFLLKKRFDEGNCGDLGKYFNIFQHS